MVGKLAVVFGASGFLGRHVVRELAAHGWRVRAAVRRPHDAHFLRPLGAVGQIDIVQANIRFRPSIAEALVGADAVINLVSILAPEKNQNFSKVNDTGARNIAELAAEQGIKTAVHVSAIGASAQSESDYAKTKAAGEAAFREHLPHTTIIRPSILFGPQDDFFNRFAAMAKLAPALPLIGGGKTVFQPIYVGDVANAILASVEKSEFAGRTYELGGPDQRSFKELLELMLTVVGRKRALMPLPFFAAHLMGKVGDIANVLPFVRAPITQDQVKLLKSDNVVGISGEDNIGTIDDFGITPESMETVLPTYLYQFRKAGQFSPEVRV